MLELLGTPVEAEGGAGHFVGVQRHAKDDGGQGAAGWAELKVLRMPPR